MSNRTQFRLLLHEQELPSNRAMQTGDEQSRDALVELLSSVIQTTMHGNVPTWITLTSATPTLTSATPFDSISVDLLTLRTVHLCCFVELADIVLEIITGRDLRVRCARWSFWAEMRSLIKLRRCRDLRHADCKHAISFGANSPETEVTLKSMLLFVCLSFLAPSSRAAEPAVFVVVTGERASVSPFKVGMFISESDIC